MTDKTKKILDTIEDVVSRKATALQNALEPMNEEQCYSLIHLLSAVQRIEALRKGAGNPHDTDILA